MQTGVLAKSQRHLSEPRGQAVLVIVVLAVSLIVRLLLFRFQGYHVDEASFSAWFSTAAEKGLHNFYDVIWCDYPPLSVYIFWLFGKLAQATGPDSLPFLIKLPQNLFDLATAGLIFSFLRHRFSFKVALAVMAIYAFNPATIFNLAVWGQMDSIHTFFMIASLYSLLRSKYELSGGLLSLAILTKPQSVVLLPIVAYVILRNGGWRRALSSSAVFGAAVFLVILPFNWDNPIAFLIDRYSGYNVYAYNSVNAYNFWALLGFWKSDTVPHLGLTYQVWGIMAFIGFASFVMWQLHRRYEPRAAVFAVFLLVFGFFMLMTRMHERYLFPVFALMALGWYTRYTIWAYLGLTVTFIAQLAYVLSVLNAGSFIPDAHWSIYVLSPANIILFGLSSWSFYRMQRPEPARPLPSAVSRPPPVVAEVEGQPPPKWREPGQRAAYVVAILAIVYFSVSVWNLGDLRAPTSDWVPQKDPEEVYLDLGATTRVDKVFLLVQDHRKVDMDLYWGSPENWTHATSLSVDGVHRQWKDLWLGQETRYVRLLFKGASGRIGEVALFSGNQRIDIGRAMGAGGEEVGAALIDEQDKVYAPISHKSRTYFDEVYYVRTAEDHLELREPSMWDHPHMGTNIIAVGIAIFGHNPFAWRIMGVIFATLMIPLVYDFARRMFGTPRAGLIAAFLLTFDFMHFVQARLGTGETFIVFFIMAMFYFFYRYTQDPSRGGKYLFLSLVFFGLGFSTKWIVMWGFIGLVLLVLLLKWRPPSQERERMLLPFAGLMLIIIPLVLVLIFPERTRWLVSLSIMFGLIPPILLLIMPKWSQLIHRREVQWLVAGGAAAVAIYLLSYIPYFLAGHGLGDFWDLQFRMFGFHSGPVGTHTWSSDWWSWPIMLTPLFMYLGSFDGATAYISSMGNPALWWAGIPLMIATIWLAVRHKNKTAAFIVIPFLAQWLIFIPITRVLFIYHFYPNVLFIILATTLWAERLWGRWRWGVVGYLALNVACFVFLFPVISGLPMPEGYWDSLRWLVGWVT